MREELELKLKVVFPYIECYYVECSDGWYQFIHDLFQEINDRYAEDGAPVDIVFCQIKGKYASLRVYYTYEDEGCLIQAFDCLTDESNICFTSENTSGVGNIMKLREDMAHIVCRYEAKLFVKVVEIVEL